MFKIEICVPINLKCLIMDLANFSSEDILQKYLVSQSKLSTMIHKPKTNNMTLSTKKELKTRIENNGPVKKSVELSKKESGSEYFPSTDSGKRKLGNYKIYHIILNFINFRKRNTYSSQKEKEKNIKHS